MQSIHTEPFFTFALKGSEKINFFFSKNTLPFFFKIMDVAG
jgi:hypothetical protein